MIGTKMRMLKSIRDYFDNKSLLGSKLKKKKTSAEDKSGVFISRNIKEKL